MTSTKLFSPASEEDAGIAAAGVPEGLLRTHDYFKGGALHLNLVSLGGSLGGPLLFGDGETMKEVHGGRCRRGVGVEQLRGAGGCGWKEGRFARDKQKDNITPCDEILVASTDGPA